MIDYINNSNHSIMIDFIKPSPAGEKPPTKSERVIEDVTQELGVSVPKGGAPLFIRLIALILIIGGVSLMASAFTNILNRNVSFGYQLISVLSGALILAAAYSLVKRMRLALWLLSIFIIIGLFVNAPLVILPAGILAFLIMSRRGLQKGPIDRWIDRVFHLGIKKGPA